MEKKKEDPLSSLAIRVILIIFFILGSAIFSYRLEGVKTKLRINSIEQEFGPRKVKLIETKLDKTYQELQRELEANQTNTQRLQELEKQKQQTESELQEAKQQLQAKKSSKATVYASRGGYAVPHAQCKAWMDQAGIIDQDLAWYIIDHESDCNPRAVNPTSRACGIAQELLEPNQRAVQVEAVNSGFCPKSKCSMDDSVCQLRWMQSYVQGRYGSWASAVSFKKSRGWY